MKISFIVHRKDCVWLGNSVIEEASHDMSLKEWTEFHIAKIKKRPFIGRWNKQQKQKGHEPENRDLLKKRWQIQNKHSYACMKRQTWERALGNETEKERKYMLHSKWKSLGLGLGM